MKTIRIAEEFSNRLVNRNRYQGDGSYHAIDFRKRFLSDLDRDAEWSSSDPFVELDFQNVRKIGPSFANEAFAYFMKYAKTKERFFEKIKMKNESRVQRIIIEEELDAGLVQR